MKLIATLLICYGLVLFCSAVNAHNFGDSTVFSFGDYVKADFLSSWYQNGDVGATSPLRDFILPGQIPIGPLKIITLILT